MYIIEYEVRGPGSFPVDMLRYDASYPRHGIDAARVEDSLTGRDESGHIITVAHRSPDKAWLPTEGRWQSFGWRVFRVHAARKEGA